MERPYFLFFLSNTLLNMSQININNPINNSLITSLADVMQQLEGLLNEPDLITKISLVFGNSTSITETQKLIKNIVTGQQLPELEVVTATTINGGNGAFDATNNKIYISSEFLEQNSNNSAAINNLLLEEFGHYLDTQLNDTDTLGDEGAIFAAIAQGQELSASQLATLQAENDTTTAIINGQATTLELNTIYGNITLDGNLADWTSNERLDFLPGSGQPGYELYGKIVGDAYVFAIKSDGTGIDAGTTVWLNTDQNATTGFQIFGNTFGAEYNINFFTDNLPYLYTGAAAENFVTGALDHAYDANRQVVEFAVPLSLLNDTIPGVDVVIDVNNQVFLPGNYSSQKYTIKPESILPPRTDTSKKVGIVFSQTTADQFFGLADIEANRTGYSQLFMSVQEEAMMAGIPFDLLTEDDLKDINKLANYDTLVFPSIRNVKQADLQQIQDTLTDAVYKYKIGIISAGDFMTNDETGAVHAGDPYYRMKTLLGLQPTAFGSGNVSLTAQNTTNPIMQGYNSGEVIRQYRNPIGFAAYQGIDARYPAQTLVNQTVNGQTYNAVVTTETGGRNVHFATTSYLGDNNLAWEALRWSTFKDQPSVSLSLTRNNSLFLSRNDMDQSQEADNVNPEDGSPGIYDRLLPILNQWKTDFNFVGSYYINIGNSPATLQYTDWAVSSPYYQALLAAGNEIGTHSYTHLEPYAGYNPTNNTNFLTPAQLEFEFNQSKQIIEQQLGITVTGAALPGAPEKLPTALEIAQYFNYISGGYSGVGAGYPGGFGFLKPGQESVYFAPNLWFDFTMLGFGIPVPDGNGGFIPQPLTAEQAQAEWIRQYREVTNHGNKPIVLMPWHDYGPTNWENNGYNQEMFTALIREAYNSGAEFVTLADASNRIKAFEQSKVFVTSSGDTITAEVIASGVGSFGLDVSGDRTIKSVNNWYAYDNNTVFLPANGGNFTINLGTTQDDVTRISELPMRANLLSLTGNGTNLDYTFSGEGKVVLKVANPDLVSIIGADLPILNGSTVEMLFATINQHQARIFTATIGDDVINGEAGQDIIVGGEGNDVLSGDRPIPQPTTVFVTDFEEAPDTGSGFLTAPLPLDGWSTTDASIEYWFTNSAEGINHIELNEDSSNRFSDARQIYRDITTEAGKYYQLTFQYAPRNGFNAQVNAIAVRLGGTTLLNLAENGTTNTSLVWKTYTVNFIGDGTTKRLEFLSTGTPVTNGRGGHLDDIRLLAYNSNPSIGGNDTITGGLGNDVIDGGAGNDVIDGDNRNTVSTVFVTDFEEAPNTSSGFVTAPLDGWNSTDGRIEYWSTGSPEGINHIELNEDPINLFPDARQIYRDVATEAGKFYQLTFQYAPRNGFNSQVNAIAVRLGGNTLLNVAENGSTNTSLVWKNYTVNFVGDGTTKRLEFLSTGTPVAFGRGGHLDNIKLLSYQSDPILGGNDIITGGRGSDIMTGGGGNDTFVFTKNQSLLAGELDIIKDFAVGQDKIQLQGWGTLNPTTWLTSIVSQGLITNTANGTLLTPNNDGQILFEGVSLSQLSGADFTFV
jgi:serralysin